MEHMLNIILRMMKNDGQMIGGALALIFLLFLVMFMLRHSRNQAASSSAEAGAVQNPIALDTLMDEPEVADMQEDMSLVQSLSPAQSLNDPLGDADVDLTLEMTHELEGADTVGVLAPEHAFSIEIEDTGPDPSLIVPQFGVPDADQSEITAEMSAELTVSEPPEDDLSIPRMGENIVSNRLAFFGGNWLSRQTEATADAMPADIPTMAAQVASGGGGSEDAIGTADGTMSEAYVNGPLTTGASSGVQTTGDVMAAPTAETISPDAILPNTQNTGAITPDAIADAVADLVGGAGASTSGAEPQIALENDEMARLAEVEKKMRALRELFQAGLIAPEVYLLKAREYATEGI